MIRSGAFPQPDCRHRKILSAFLERCRSQKRKCQRRQPGRRSHPGRTGGHIRALMSARRCPAPEPRSRQSRCRSRGRSRSRWNLSGHRQRCGRGVSGRRCHRHARLWSDYWKRSGLSGSCRAALMKPAIRQRSSPGQGNPGSLCCRQTFCTTARMQYSAASHHRLMQLCPR